jgi:hypothetical protein
LARAGFTPSTGSDSHAKSLLPSPRRQSPKHTGKVSHLFTGLAVLPFLVPKVELTSPVGLDSLLFLEGLSDRSGGDGDVLVEAAPPPFHGGERRGDADCGVVR